MKTRILTVSTLLVMVLLLGVYLRMGSQDKPQPAPRGPAGAAPTLGFAFPRGDMRTYSLRWNRRDQTVLPMAGQATDGLFVARLEAEMTMVSLGVEGNATVLALSLPRFTAAHVELLGETLIDSAERARESLSGQMAYLEVDRRGRARAIRFEDGATDLFRHLMTSLAAELDVELPAGLDRWSGSGPGSFGTAEVVFAWNEGQLHRQRVGYPGSLARNLSSRAAISLDDTGVMVKLSAFEQADFAAGQQPARSGHVETELVQLRRETLTLDAQAKMVLDGTEPQPLGVPRAGTGVDQKLLEQRIAGLSGAQMAHDLGEFARLGALPDESRWLWRATGLLRQEPGLAAEVEKLFEQPAFSPRARGFALDLLVLADTPEAQGVVQRVLVRPEVQADEGALTDTLQRLAAVKTPTPESVAAVRAMYGSGGRRDTAATYTLGALAHALAQSGQDAAADELVATLSQGLVRARTDEARASHIGALGNAGTSGGIAQIAGYQADKSPLVRAAVARGLRKTPTPAARQTLHTLTIDDDRHVQRAALGTLGSVPLERGDIDWLAASMAKVDRRNDALVLSLAANQLDTAAAHEILGEIIARNGDDPELRARARRLLAEPSKSNR